MTAQYSKQITFNQATAHEMTLANENQNKNASKNASTSITCELDIFDLKYMADTADRYKQHALDALRYYRVWKRSAPSARVQHQGGAIIQISQDIETSVLQRRAKDSVRLYWQMRKYLRRATDEYVSRLAHRT